MSRSRRLFSLVCLVICAGLMTGCASYKPIPQAYLHPPHSAEITFKRVPKKPAMLDSGQGGLIGAIITGTSRTQRMREQLSGIDGEQVKSLLAEELRQRLAEHVGLDQNPPTELRIEVSVYTWGWFVPTTTFGIKVGEYQSQILGRVDVYDAAQNKKIAYANLEVQRRLGLKPEEDNARTAFTEVAKAFADQAEEALIHSLRPDELASAGR